MNRHLHYTVYGRQLCSNVPLTELPRSRFRARDLAFRFVNSDDESSLFDRSAKRLTRKTTNLGCDLSVYDSGKGYLLNWEGWCDFHVSSDGQEIICQALGEQTGPGWVSSTLYGMVLSFALHLGGVGNLHASSIALNGEAVGFLADPGSGKSTLATAFARAGYPFLTDDVLALKASPHGYTAYPGFPYVSLSERSIDALLQDSEKPLQKKLNADKYRVHVDGNWASFQESAVDLKGLFLLSRVEEGASIGIERVARVEAIRQLLENTNCAPILPSECIRRQMAFLTRLTESIPVWRLTYPTDYDGMTDVIERVVETVGTDSILQSVSGR